MKKRNDYVHTFLLDKFGFLIKDYNFSLIHDKLSDWGFRLIFRGTKTAVTILFEFREAYVHILLHRLVDGKIEHDPNPFQDDVPLLNIGLDWIVKYKDPSKLTRPLYNDTTDYYGKEDAFEIMVGRLADNLRNFAGSILEGDFSLFSKVDSMVKEHKKPLPQKSHK